MIHFFKHIYSLYKNKKSCLKKQGYVITGLNNKIIIIENGIERQIGPKERIPGIDININGNNNVLKFEMPIYASDVTVSVSNDGVDFYLGKSDYIKNVLFMFQFGSNQVCKIGQNCTFEQAKIFSCSNGGGLIIGDDCMFSTDIYIWCSDGHVVVNEDTGDVLNNVKGPITIGNHCWICQGARITKNAVIHDNSIVGNSAVVYKDYIENNVIISGNPGQIVKHGITWKREHN